MPSPIEMVDAKFFSNAFHLEWWDTGLSTGQPFGLSSCRFTFSGDPQVITLDVNNVSVHMSYSPLTNDEEDKLIGFPKGVSVILADNLPGAPPLHLQCDVPLRSAGMEVSAVVPGPSRGMGGRYHATLWVRLAGQTDRWPVSKCFTLDPGFNTAPCLAVKVLPGEPGIVELWVDVHGESNASRAPDQVAIDDFWFTE